jgi:hypothetical protein
MPDENLVNSLTEEEVLALATVYYQPLATSQLLTKAGLPGHLQPAPAANAYEYWTAVNGVLAAGRLPGGRVRILEIAAHDFPANGSFHRALAAARRAAAAAAVAAAATAEAVAAVAAATAEALDPPAPATPAPGATGIPAQGAGPSPTSGTSAGTGPTTPSPGPGAAVDGTPPVVFISYAHESDEHKNAVRDLWLVLRDNGVDAKLDAPAAEVWQDWPLWMEEQVDRSAFVLVIASKAYKLHAGATPITDRGRGVQYEASLLREKIYADRATWRGKVLPVLLPTHGLDEVPAWLGPFSTTSYRVPTIDAAGCGTLLRVLLGQPYETEPPVRSRPILPPRDTTVPGTAAAGQGSAPATGAATPAATGATAAPSAAPELDEDGLPPLRADGTRWDFYVSVAEADLRWGGWITSQLESADYLVRFDPWDTQAGDDTIQALDSGGQLSQRTVIVWSKDSVDDNDVTNAWHTAFNADRLGKNRALIPVRVDNSRPRGLLGNIKPIELLGLPPDEAGRHLLEQISRSVAGRYRPTTPPTMPTS